MISYRARLVMGTLASGPCLPAFVLGDQEWQAAFTEARSTERGQRFLSRIRTWSLQGSAASRVQRAACYGDGQSCGLLRGRAVGLCMCDSVRRYHVPYSWFLKRRVGVRVPCSPFIPPCRPRLVTR